MKQILLKTCMLFTVWASLIASGNAQVNIVAGEYFFDTDPGYGNGTSITISLPAPNLPGILVNANTAPLTFGVHALYIRTRDANGIWSMTNTIYFAKVAAISNNSNSINNINTLEYFYDIDPGFGNGTNVPITASTNISSLLVNVNVASLSTGVHTLYIRARDSLGKWSMTNNFNFAKVQLPIANANSISKINKLEYFYDTDLGYGNGTDIPISSASNISSLLVNVNVASLSDGVHTLYIRSRDSLGKWSMANNFNFAKVKFVSSNPYTSSNINKMEYFFNTDPGYGNGVNVPITSAANINGFLLNANLVSLPSGLHTLYIRTRDTLGNWSMTNSFTFTKLSVTPNNPFIASKINKVEYFYDLDPGYGNGVNVPVTPGVNLSGLVINTDVTALANGVHTLYIRSRDSLGLWSMTNSFNFAKVQTPFGNTNITTSITQAEYYYNTDPGFGNGTSIPSLTGANNLTNVTFNASVASLPNGVHTLYIRTKDSLGKWSMTNSFTFAKVQALFGNPHTISDIVYVEYFVDIDPGFGNGVSVPVPTPSSNVTPLSFNVDMTFLVNGAHRLYIRSKDAQGKWSITNIFSFNGGMIPLSIKLISFEATVYEKVKAQLRWVTENEQQVSHYTIERSKDATTWKLVGSQKPKSNNANNRNEYQLIDDEPGLGITYYRLTEHDQDGKTSIAPIRFITIENGSASLATLFPNPNNGKLVTIQSDILKQDGVEVTIITTDGKLYYKQSLSTHGASSVTLSELELPVATYFVNLKSGQQSQSLKLQVVGK